MGCFYSRKVYRVGYPQNRQKTYFQSDENGHEEELRPIFPSLDSALAEYLHNLLLIWYPALISTCITTLGTCTHQRIFLEKEVLKKVACNISSLYLTAATAQLRFEKNFDTILFRTRYTRNTRAIAGWKQLESAYVASILVRLLC